MRSVLVTVFAVFLVTACSKDDSNVQPEQHSSYEYKQIEDEVFRLVNEHRASQELPPLKADTLIIAQARKHSINMASGAVAFGHDGFSERFNTLKTKLQATAGAENVAMGYATPQAVVTGWLNSSGHRANIEGNYTLSGIGIAKSKNGNFYYTQIFIKN